MAAEIIKNDSMLRPMLSETVEDTESAEICKYLLMQHITYYNEEWYCVLCSYFLRDLIAVEHHLEEAHSETSIEILNCLDKFSEFSDVKYRELIDNGIVIQANSQGENNALFCVNCRCLLVSLKSIEKHFKGKKHQYYINAAIRKQKCAFIDIENLLKQFYKLESLEEIQTIYENMLLKNHSSDMTVQMTNENIISDSMPSPVPSKIEFIDIYKLLLANRITYYTGQWHCYLHGLQLKSFTELKYHLQEIHSNISIYILDLVYILDEFSDKECKQLLSHGIVIHSLPTDYFCLWCQCSLSALNSTIMQHIEGKKHQKHINISIVKDESVQQDINDHTSNTQSNVSVNKKISIEYIDELKSVTKTQIVCKNKGLKNLPSDDSVQTSEITANDSILSPVPSNIKSVKLLLAHCITYYKEQWYCYLCKFQLQNFTEAKHHLQKTHSDININISDFLNAIDKFSDIDYEQFLNHGIIIQALPYYFFCIYCQCPINDLNNIAEHVKGKKHQKHINVLTIMENIENVQENLDDHANNVKNNISVDEGNLIKHTNDSDSLTKIQIIHGNKSPKNLPNEYIRTKNKIIKNSTFYPVSLETKSVDIYKSLLAHRITYYNGQWYCYLCKSLLQNFAETKCHLQKTHSDISKYQIPDFRTAIDKFSNTECKQFLNHGLVIKALPKHYFCLYCQRSIYHLDHIEKHIKGKKHQKHVNPAVMTLLMENIASIQENLNDHDTNNMQSNISLDEETSMKYINESESIIKMQTMYDNKLPEDLPYDSTLMTNKINENDSILYSIQKDKIADPDININISDFSKTKAFSDIDCEQHGLVIEALSKRYFCVYCQCSIHTVNIARHVKGKKHQNHLNVTIIKDVENAGKILDDHSNSTENVSTDKEYLIEHTNESDCFTETQEVYKHLMIQSITRYNEQWYCYLCQSLLLNITEAKYHSQKVHPNNQISILNFPDDFIKLSEKKSKIFVKHGIIIKELPDHYFCIHCQCSIYDLYNIKSHLKKTKHKNCFAAARDIKNIGRHAHDNIDDKYSNASVDKDASMERVDQLRTTEVQTTEIQVHKSEQKSINKISNPFIEAINSLSLDMKFTNIYKYFVAQRITRYDGQWYCYLCKCVLQNVEIGHHLRENHSNITSQIPDFLESLADLSDMRCRELLNHGIVMSDLQIYFCVPCQCPMPSLYHIDGHIRGNRHKKHIENILKLKNILKNSANEVNDEQSNISVDTGTTKQHFVEFSAKTQVIYEKEVKVSSYKSDTKKNTLSSNSNEENNENDDILNIETTVDYALFCSLCDIFIDNFSTKGHILSEQHVSLVKIFNQQAKYIIKLELAKNIIRSLQSNIRKWDGTVWSKYIVPTTMFTCDKCETEMIEENDLVNHEITLHKDNARSISGIDNQTFTFKIKLLVHIYSSRFKNYPMFKCSLCNEIIHGVLLLQNHFSKCTHEENISKLAQIKMEEYNDCKNVKDSLELLEFLSIISFKNDNETLRAMEQPVIYIKTRNTYYKNPKCSIQKRFIYICIICRCIFHRTQDVIEHFRKKGEHLHQFENILHTYNLIYQEMYLTTSLENYDAFGHQIIKFPVSPAMNVSTNSSIKLEESVNETCLMRKANNPLEIAMNIDFENDSTSYKNEFEESAAGFFMSPDIAADINVLIKNQKLGKHASSKLLRIVPDEVSISALDYYNQIYQKKYLEFEEIMFVCNTRRLKKIESNLCFYIPCSNETVYCLACDIMHSYDMLFEHSHSIEHIMCSKLPMEKNKDLKNERLKLLKELIISKSTYTKCYACDMSVKLSSDSLTSHITSPSHKTNRKKLLVQMKDILEEFKNLWYSIQYFACVECNFRYKRKIDFMKHLRRHIVIENTDNNSNFDFCITCATLWYGEKDPTMTHSKHCEKRTHQYLVKTNDFIIKPLSQTTQKLLKNINESVAELFEQAENALRDPRPIQLESILEHVFKSYNLPVKISIFGSRVTGLALLNSDVDIYLDFGKYI